MSAWLLYGYIRYLYFCNITFWLITAKINDDYWTTKTHPQRIQVSVLFTVYYTILDHHGLTSLLFLAQQWLFPQNPNIRLWCPLLKTREKAEGRAKEKARAERRTPAWGNTKISAFMECVIIWRSYSLILVCEFHALLLFSLFLFSNLLLLRTGSFINEHHAVSYLTKE